MNWPVYINKHARENLKFYPVLDFSGGVKLSWPQYNYADFGSYEISWYSDRGSGSKQIKDPHQIFFIDSSLIEGCYSSYSLTYNLINGLSSDYLFYATRITDPVVKVNGDWTVDVSWKWRLILN